MYRGSIATVLAILHGTTRNITETIKPIYKETWWEEQRQYEEKEKILFYRGRSLLTEVNVGTIGHVDYDLTNRIVADAILGKTYPITDLLFGDPVPY